MKNIFYCFLIKKRMVTTVWNGIAVAGFLMLAVFILLAFVALFKRNGKAKRNFGIAALGLILIMVGAIGAGSNNDPNDVSANTVTTATKVPEVPEYKIVKEDDGAKGQHVYLRVSTDATSEEDLRAIVADIRVKYLKPQAVWLWMHKVDDNPNGNGYGDLKAAARFGNTKLGIAAVGVKSTSEYFFEMK